MARTRNIKPGTYDNEQLAECTIPARWLFPALWQLADRDGYLEDRPRRIKKHAYGYDTIDVVPLLDELKENGFIEYVTRESDGTSWIFIPTFSKHQSPHKFEKALYKNHTSTIPAPDESGNAVEGTRKKVEGKQKKEEGRAFSKWFDEEFWPLYPLQTDEEKARELAAKIPPEDRPAVIAAIEDQLTWPAEATTGLNPDRAKLPQPATWIRGKRWRDKIPKKNTTPKRTAKIKFDENGDAVVDKDGNVIRERVK